MVSVSVKQVRYNIIGGNSMAQVTEYNLIGITKKHIQKEIRESIIDALVEEEVEAFKEKIRPIIKDRVEEIVIETIENVRDLATLRDEYRVFISWKGSN